VSEADDERYATVKKLRADIERLRRLFLLILEDEYSDGDRLIKPFFAPIQDVAYVQALWDSVHPAPRQEKP
jgi:hypothetical protein